MAPRYGGHFFIYALPGTLNVMKAVHLSGVTKHYKGNGRKLGYPTANIAADTHLTDGVYFGFASLGRLLNKPALIFIGVPTTVGDTTRRVEAYLLDIADKDHYNERLKLDIRRFYRPNEKFDSVEELLVQMKKDEQDARDWFKIIQN